VLKVKLSLSMAVARPLVYYLWADQFAVFSQGGAPIAPALAPQAGGGANIALLDVSYIFKKSS